MKLNAIVIRMFVFGLSILLFSECSTALEEVPISTLTTVKGKITTINEFGILIEERLGVNVLATKGSDISEAKSESSGAYSIGLSAGTYDFTYEKEGFGVYKSLGWPIVGNATISNNVTLSRISTTKFEDLEISVSGFVLNLKGKIVHNNSFNSPQTSTRVLILVGDSADVSPNNYLSSFTTLVQGVSGSNVSINMSIGSLFPTGATRYVTVHGISYFDGAYLDILTDKIVYPTVNPTGSNIAMITL